MRYSILFASMFLLAACDDDAPRRTVVVQSPEPVVVQQTPPVVVQQPTCDRFYDAEEMGFTTRCFDTANTSCYTLYEPDGDTEYYCNGIKIWEHEPDDYWDNSVGWAFVAGMALAEVSKPKYVSDSHKPTSTRPTTYKKPVYTTTIKKSQTATKTQTTVTKPATKSFATTDRTKSSYAKPSTTTQSTTVSKPTTTTTKTTTFKPAPTTKPKTSTFKPATTTTKKSTTFKPAPTKTYKSTTTKKSTSTRRTTRKK